MRILISARRSGNFQALASFLRQRTEIADIEQHEYYDIRTEHIWFDGSGRDEPVVMRVGYNKQGKYIGEEAFTRRLVDDLGIIPDVANPGDTVCSIGFCPKEQAWYGWSHRGRASFKVGSVVRPGDCAYTPDTLDSWIQDVVRWHTSDVDNRSKSSITFQWSAEDQTLTVCDSSTSNKCQVVKFDPKNLGEGEWQAETLDDARHMARRYAAAVASSALMGDAKLAYATCETRNGYMVALIDNEARHTDNDKLRLAELVKGTRMSIGRFTAVCFLGMKQIAVSNAQNRSVVTPKQIYLCENYRDQEQIQRLISVCRSQLTADQVLETTAFYNAI
jgi:hypothetical protein